MYRPDPHGPIEAIARHAPAMLDQVGMATCRGCACDDWHACPGGCAWVEDPLGQGDLCSSCLIRIWNGQPLPLEAPS